MEDAVNLNTKTRDQKSDIWLLERKMRITASECYTLFTALKNPNTVWPSKIRSYYKTKPNCKNFEIGHREERNAIKLYESKTKRKVSKLGLLVHPTCPWIGCSPDGFVLESKTLVEDKTLINDDNKDFKVALKSVKYLKVNTGCYVLREKHKIYGQCQINMHFLSAVKTDLVIHNYKSNEIKIIIVNYDKEFVCQLLNSLEFIYTHYALPFIFKNFTTASDKQKYSVLVDEVTKSM